MSPRSIAFAALSVLLFAGSARAAGTCTVKSHVWVSVQANTPVTKQNDVRLDTGELATAPAVANGVGTDHGGPNGAKGDGTYVATSSFGKLTLLASCSADNSDVTGASTVLSAWMGNEPNAKWTDTLTLDHPTASMVQVRVVEHLAATSMLMSLPAMPFTSSNPEGYIRLTYDGPKANGMLPDVGIAAAPVTQDVVQVLDLPTGSPITFVSRLHFNMDCSANQTMPAYHAEGSADLSLATTFEVLTAGATATWCSGTNYAPAGSGGAGGAGGTAGTAGAGGGTAGQGGSSAGAAGDGGQGGSATAGGAGSAGESGQGGGTGGAAGSAGVGTAGSGTAGSGTAGSGAAGSGAQGGQASDATSKDEGGCSCGVIPASGEATSLFAAIAGLGAWLRRRARRRD